MPTEKPQGKYSGPVTDCRPLMLQIASMANMDYAGIRRMVLVLDVNDIPRLYVESNLDRERSEGVELEKTPLDVKLEKVDFKETTAMQNEMFRTYAVPGESSGEVKS